MTFETPERLAYLDTHEWVTQDGDERTVGITDFAQDELGDVIFVELPAAGEEFDAGEQFGTIESIKATSDLYIPISGQITEVNSPLEGKPQLVNEDPYGDGWMLKVAPTDEENPDLMTADEYQQQTE